MANVAVTTLVQDIISDIPEIPVFVATRQYLRALRVLCEQARVWRINFDVNTVASQDSYDISAYFPSNTELVDILSWKPEDGSTTVKPKTYAWLDKNEADWRTQEALIANYYVLESNNTIRLVPTSSETTASAYHVRAAIKPTTDATQIESLLPNKYSETLINGAKAFLFMTPRKPWTDLQLAQYHQSAFLASIPDARSEAADEFQTGVARKVKYGGL
jgi:hypothetical protein